MVISLTIKFRLLSEALDLITLLWIISRVDSETDHSNVQTSSSSEVVDSGDEEFSTLQRTPVCNHDLDCSTMCSLIVVVCRSTMVVAIGIRQAR